jgi:ATP-dependent DNA ligase
MLQRGSRVVRLVEPCLPSPAKAPPSGPGWLHEIGVRLVTRNGNDFTKRFPLVVAAIAAGALLLDRRLGHFESALGVIQAHQNRPFVD